MPEWHAARIYPFRMKDVDRVIDELLMKRPAGFAKKASRALSVYPYFMPAESLCLAFCRASSPTRASGVATYLRGMKAPAETNVDLGPLTPLHITMLSACPFGLISC